MFNLSKNNVLSGTLIISKQNNTVEVTIDEPKDNIFFFRINKENKVCSFVELKNIKDNLYACVIPYTKEMEDESKIYTADMVISNGNESIYSNIINIKFYREKIQGQIVEASTAELLEIKKELSNMSKKIDIAFSGRLPKAVPEFKLENCKKGMVPTVISDNGVIAFTYPFSDILNEINGKKSVMRKITLDTNDIKLYNEETNLDTLIKAMRDNQKKESEILKQILSSISDLTTRVAGLESTLVDFKNNQ